MKFDIRLSDAPDEPLIADARSKQDAARQARRYMTAWNIRARIVSIRPVIEEPLRLFDPEVDPAQMAFF